MFLMILQDCTKSLLTCFPNSTMAPQHLPNDSEMVPRGSQNASKSSRSRSGVALGAHLVAPGTLLGRSWDALGRSWMLLDALGRSWDALGTLVARSRDLRGWILGSPGTPQSHFESILRATERPNANIPKVDRRLSENCRKPRRNHAANLIPTPRALRRIPTECGGLREANSITLRTLRTLCRTLGGLPPPPSTSLRASAEHHPLENFFCDLVIFF